ncbi:MAG: hypothetical protein ACR2PL_10965 [Dehalococcoidia bacterium]
MSEILGVNCFEVFARNLRNGRVPVQQNREFVDKKSAVVKRLISSEGDAPYASFLAFLREDQALWNDYDWRLPLGLAEWQDARQWCYPLRILVNSPASDMISRSLNLVLGRTIITSIPLDLQAAAFRLDEDTGFVTVYKPNRTSSITASCLKKQYRRLRNLRDAVGYVQFDREGRTLLTKHLERNIQRIEESYESPESRVESHLIPQEQIQTVFVCGEEELDEQTKAEYPERSYEDIKSEFSGHWVAIRPTRVENGLSITSARLFAHASDMASYDKQLAALETRYPDLLFTNRFIPLASPTGVV